jgi:hypothetical protein
MEAVEKGAERAEMGFVEERGAVNDVTFCVWSEGFCWEVR